jgi:hypothetical protein
LAPNGAAAPGNVEPGINRPKTSRPGFVGCGCRVGFACRLDPWTLAPAPAEAIFGGFAITGGLGIADGTGPNN